MFITPKKNEIDIIIFGNCSMLLEKVCICSDEIGCMRFRQ